MRTGRVCGRCGTVVSSYGPDGLCPKCLLLGGLGTDDAPRAAGVEGGPEVRWFGDYELLEEIAHGGMGIVYKARQVSLNRIVAVKLLLFGRFSTPEFVQRFHAEATAVARLQHPNIVAIHEVGEHDGQHYFSMDYVEGQSLADMLQPLPPRQAAEYLKRIVEAIHYAHEKGVLHRDLKPSNILIDEFGQPRITDFGLAKQFDSTCGGFNQSAEMDLTVPGQVLGSPSYMPPEQARGKREAMSRASDVYSLGALLFHMLAGRPPFLAESVAETLDQVCHAEPVSPRLLNPGTPRDLETICLKCLQKEPLRRYQTARELAEDLGRFLRDEPIHARPAGLASKAGRWARRNPVVAGLLLSLVMVLSAGLLISTMLWRRAELNAIAAHQGLVRMNIATGTRLAEEGNPLGALVWFSEGFSKDRDRAADSADIHRRRLGWILRRAPKLLQLWTYDEPVNRAQFTPDGRHVLITTGAAADAETSIHSLNVLDIDSGRLVARFMPASDTGVIHLTEDGSLLASGDAQGTLRIWNVANGTRHIEVRAHADSVQSVRFSPDARTVLSVGRDGTANILDTATGKQLATTIRHRNSLAFGEFSPDGGRVVTASTDGRLRVWDASTGAPITEWVALGSAPSRVLFSPNSRWIFAGAANRAARIFDAATGKLRVSGILCDGYQPRVAFSGDSSRVAVATRDSFVRIWDTATGTLAAPPLRHEHAIFSLAFSREGRWLATGAGDWQARIWDVTTGELVVPPLLHGGMVNHVAFNPDGHRLATASADGSARVWDLALPPLFAPVEPEPSHGQMTAVSPNVDRAAVWQGRNIVLRTLASAQAITKLQSTEDVETVSFSPNGKLLLSRGTRTLQIWSAESSACIATLALTNAVRDARFTEDGQRIIVQADESCQLINARTEPVTLLRRLNGRPLAVSRDGRWVVVAAGGGAQVMDLVADESIFLPQRGKIHGAEFDRDGRRLLILAREEVPCIWDWQGHRDAPVLRLSEARRANVASFSPDGKRLATASSDSTARVWDCESGQPLTPVLQHGHGVRGLTFNADGRFLLTWTANDRVRIWDSATGVPVTPPVNSPPFYDVRFALDSSQIVGFGTTGPYVFSFAAEPRPMDALNVMAELLGSHRLDGMGGVIPLSAGGLRQRWEAAKARDPSDFLMTSAELLSWHRQQLDRAAAKRQWQAMAFHAERSLGYQPDDVRVQQLLRSAQSHLIRTGSLAVDATTLARSLPARDANASRELIDLTCFYNGLLIEDVHPSTTGAQTGNNLAELPVGIQKYGGVDFDVRGIIRLYGKVYAQRGANYPEAVRNIPIQQRAQRIHFLHGTGYGAENGVQIGSLLIRFGDGLQEEFPIVYGEQVLNWWSDAKDAFLADNTTVAWVGLNARIRSQKANLHLYRSTWFNQTPESEIESIDFISSRAATGPFLIAITVEP